MLEFTIQMCLWTKKKTALQMSSWLKPEIISTNYIFVKLILWNIRFYLHFALRHNWTVHWHAQLNSSIYSIHAKIFSNHEKLNTLFNNMNSILKSFSLTVSHLASYNTIQRYTVYKSDFWFKNINFFCFVSLLSFLFSSFYILSYWNDDYTARATELSY